MFRCIDITVFLFLFWSFDIFMSEVDILISVVCSVICIPFHRVVSEIEAKSEL